MKCAASTRWRRLVSAVFIKGSTDTTIGNSRIALTVTATAACTTVAPEPSVEIRMICAGPAHTRAVLARAPARGEKRSWAGGPPPRKGAEKTRGGTGGGGAGPPPPNTGAGAWGLGGKTG